MQLALFLLISVMSAGAFAQSLKPVQLSEQLVYLQERLEELEDTKAFTAHMLPSPEEAKINEVIPFPVNLTNVGLAYKVDSYSFVAPKTGVYAFYVKVDCTADYRVLNLVVNGMEKIGTGHNDVDDRTIGTFAIVVLKVGDIVDVRHGRDAGKVDGGPESVFSGWWLGPDHSVYKPEDLPRLF